MKFFSGQLFSEADYFAAGPGEEPVFVLESSPWRDEGDNFQGRPEAGLQIFCVRLCQEGHVVMLAGGLEKRRSDDQITQSP